MYLAADGRGDFGGAGDCMIRGNLRPVSGL